MSDGRRIEHFIYAYDGRQFAVPVLEVLEIIDLVRLLPAQADIPACAGQVVHRNFLIPVLDSARLGTGAWSEDAPKTAIIIEHDGVLFGLTIDRHVAVVALGDRSEAPRDPPPGAAEGGASGGPAGRFIEATRAYRDDLLIVLSVPALAASIRRIVGDQLVVRDDDGQRTDGQTEHSGPPQDFLCAGIENVCLAVALASVVEVIEGHDVTPLFHVHPMLRGLINLRGQVFACLDISAEMGFPLRVLEERNQFVVLHDDGVDLALCVDRVEGIRSLHLDRLQSAETLLASGVARYFEGVLETERGPFLFLSVPTLLESPHLQPYRSFDG